MRRAAGNAGGAPSLEKAHLALAGLAGLPFWLSGLGMNPCLGKGERHPAQLGVAEVAQAEGQIGVLGINLGEQPRRIRVGGEEFDHRREVDAACTFGVRPALIEHLALLFFGDEFHVPCPLG